MSDGVSDEQQVDWLAIAKTGQVVVNIGQIPPESKRQLDAAARRGEIKKWRGYWYPTPGDPRFGLGSLKTCYSLTNPYADNGEISHDT